MVDPVTPVTPRIQRLCLDPICRPGRSADSGYGSHKTSPTRNRQPVLRRLDRISLSLTSKSENLGLSSYDGNSSEESDTELCALEHEDSDGELPDSPCNGRGKFSTLPRTARRRLSRTDTCPLVPERRKTDRRHGSDNTGTISSRVNSLRTLDRFVPARNHATPGSEKLHTSRPMNELTLSERLVRHNQDAPDPFCFRRRAHPPSPSEMRKAARLRQSRTVLDPEGTQMDRRVVCHAISVFLIPFAS